MQCRCPLPDFPQIEDCSCMESFGQIQKLIFVDLRDPEVIGWESRVLTSNPIAGSCAQHLGVDSISMPSFTGEYGILRTPFVGSPTQEPSEARVYGENSNDTPGGIGMYLGQSPTLMTFRGNGWPASMLAELKKLACIAEAGLLGVYFVNGNGDLEGLLSMTPAGEEIDGDPASEDVYWLDPIPVRMLRLSDKIHGNYDEPDHCELGLTFSPDWTDNLFTIKSPNVERPGDYNSNFLYSNTVEI